MENAIPLNEAAAEKQLLTEYHRVSGKPADTMAEMICKISAKRALSGEPWKWIKDESSPNWSMQLHWGTQSPSVGANEKKMTP